MRKGSWASHLFSVPIEALSSWEDEGPVCRGSVLSWALASCPALCFVAHCPTLSHSQDPGPWLQPSSLSSPCKCLLCPPSYPALRTHAQGVRQTFWPGGAGVLQIYPPPWAEWYLEPVEPLPGCCLSTLFPGSPNPPWSGMQTGSIDPGTWPVPPPCLASLMHWQLPPLPPPSD